MTRKRSGGGGRKRKASTPWSRYATVLCLIAAGVVGIYLATTRFAPGLMTAASATPPAPAAAPGGEGASAETAQPAPAAARPAPQPSADVDRPQPPAEQEAGLPSRLMPLLLTLILSLVGGVIGGWLAFRAMKIREHLERLDHDFQNHWRHTDKGLADLREQMQRPPAAAAPPRQQPGYGLSRVERPDHRPPPAADRPPEPRREAPEPRPAPMPDLAQVAAGYGRLTRGNISRSDFARFFEALGTSSAVESAAGGTSLQQAQSEDFLTAVSVGGRILVFPSYNFVANWDTQFTTMASVPESVAEVFDLARGDGEIVMSAPALYEEDGGAPRRLQRGVISGFQG